MDSEKRKLKSTVSCTLEAPTFTVLQQRTLRIAHLEGYKAYHIMLKKLHASVLDDKLVVSFKLGLNQNFTTFMQNSEQNLFNKWKALHQTERMFDIGFYNGKYISGNEIVYEQIGENDSSADLVKLIWNKQKQIELCIRFNCVSSQFAKTDSEFVALLDSILQLQVDVSSEDNSKQIESLFCQIRIDWFASKNAVYESVKLEAINAGKQPKFEEIFKPKEKTILAEYGSKRIHNKTYLNHTLEQPKTPFYSYENRKGIKNIFVSQNQTISIKIKSNNTNEELQNQIVFTKIELLPNNCPFDQEKIYDWTQKNEGKLQVIAPNFKLSNLPIYVKDIRVVKSCEIEIIWLFQIAKNEMIFSFDLNYHSKDSSLLRINSYLKDLNFIIGSAKVRTSTQDTSEPKGIINVAKQFWQPESFKDLFVNQVCKLLQNMQNPHDMYRANFTNASNEFKNQTNQMHSFMMDKDADMTNFAMLMTTVECKMQEVKNVQKDLKIIENFIIKLVKFVVLNSKMNHDKLIEPYLDVLIEEFSKHIIFKKLTYLRSIKDFIINEQETVSLNEIEQLFEQVHKLKHCESFMVDFLCINQAKFGFTG